MVNFSIDRPNGSIRRIINRINGSLIHRIYLERCVLTLFITCKKAFLVSPPIRFGSLFVAGAYCKHIVVVQPLILRHSFHCDGIFL